MSSSSPAPVPHDPRGSATCASVSADALRRDLVAWPPATEPPLPPALPDGTAWPRISVLVTGRAGQGGAGPGGAGQADAASLASIAAQGYPDAAAMPVPGGPARLAEAVARSSAEYVLVLQAGDLLLPGALAALALAARLEGADAVAGIRVVGGRDVAWLDILSCPPGHLTEEEARAAVRPAMAGADPGSAPFRGGDILLRREAIRCAGGVSPDATEPMAELWPRLARSGLRLARIGRPVLLQHEPAARPTPLGRPLRIAAVNDAGPSGGAGIAHRRLVEALRLAGHEVAEHALARESSPLAAEWTEAFPTTEAAIRAGRPDLVLAGNIHGATRTSAVLERLGAHVPVLAVLHDLFLLTGRCSHPGPCRRFETGCDALCPTATLYPQLDPARIAATFAGKRRFLGEPTRPLLLANSRWTAERARELAPAAAVGRIDLAFPTQVFRPDDKARLRRELGLPADDILILFGGVIADQPAKGGSDLVRALARVARPGIGFVALGRIDDPGAFPLPNLFAPGPVGDEAELAAWYGACDLHVTASTLETLGQIAVEAGLCGVPTVAYRLTGLTTAVIDGVSGLLVEPTPEALTGAIETLIADPALRAGLSRWGRIALESRNSHVASALGLHDALVGLGLQPNPAAEGRIRFGPDALGFFALAATRRPGARGTVKPAPSRVVRLARRLKQRVWGRAQPLWMRRAVFLADRLRRNLRGALGGRQA